MPENGSLRAVGVVVLCLSTLACASAARRRPLSDTLPPTIPSAATRASWERIDGDYETPTEHVRYALFVDPEQPLLFRITQYRVSRRQAPRGDEGAETVIWNEVPGARIPLKCFSEEAPWKARPKGVGATWRAVQPGSLEFRANMHRALEIYGRVQREGRAGPPVR